MNIQDFLTYAIEAIACGFIALALLDLGDHISNEILDIFCTIAPTPGAQRNWCMLPLPRRKLKSLQPQTFEMPVVEDPWGAVHHAIPLVVIWVLPPTNQKPLLLPHSQATRSCRNAQHRTRKLCSERGIKWRNAHQNKHLTKPEMLAALTT